MGSLWKTNIAIVDLRLTNGDCPCLCLFTRRKIRSYHIFIILYDYELYIYIYSVLHLYLIPNSIPTIFPLYSHDIPMIFPLNLIQSQCFYLNPPVLRPRPTQPAPDGRRSKARSRRRSWLRRQSCDGSRPGGAPGCEWENDENIIMVIMDIWHTIYNMI